MPRNQIRKASSLEPLAADDLKVINGIGPAVESRLRKVGISTFAQLAALSPADIAALVADLSGLSAERISKQDWIGQARKLALSARVLASEQAIQSDDVTIVSLQQESLEEASVEKRQADDLLIDQGHTATFTVELLLDEERQVSSTRVVHQQSGEEKNWSGWRAIELISFLVQSAHLNLSLGELTPTLTTSSALREVEAISLIGKEAKPAEVTQPSPTAANREPPAILSARDNSMIHDHSLAGSVRLVKIDIANADSAGPHYFLSGNNHPLVQLTLDLSEVTSPANALLAYKALLYGKNVGRREHQVIGEAHGSIAPDEVTVVSIEAMQLTHGLYRLRASVSLSLASTGEKRTSMADLMAVIEGGMLQVY